jgi:hypothetical protein
MISRNQQFENNSTNSKPINLGKELEIQKYFGNSQLFIRFSGFLQVKIRTKITYK